MKLLRVALPVWMLLLAFAFVAAPKSCEWGLSAYTWTGIAMLIALPCVILVRPAEAGGGRRALRILGAVAGTTIVWVAGLFLANVRIICRLF